MTATEPPAEMIVCPWCTSLERLQSGEALPNFRCDECNGEGFIPDPRIATWNGNDPAAMLELCERDEAKLQAWAASLNDLWISLSQPRTAHISDNDPEYLDPNYWLNEYLIADTGKVRLKDACELLRCIYPPPWLRRTCPECNRELPNLIKARDVLRARKINVDFAFKCNNPSCKDGIIPDVEIDPRWLNSTVCDLVRVAKGDREMFVDTEISMREAALIVASRANDVWIKQKSSRTCTLTRKIIEPPDYSILPILADALYEEGCDIEELTKHFWDGKHHVKGHCWALEALAKGVG